MIKKIKNLFKRNSKSSSINILIACEESQVVCSAFRKLGFNAFSCDLLLPSGSHPEWHIQCDVLDLLKENSIKFQTLDGKKHHINHWTLLIGHPNCQRLTVTANKWYKAEFAERFPTIHEDREKAVDFFMQLINAPIKHIAIENPIGIMSTRYQKPSQIVQPYYFGDTERKATCLWLKNLPPLIPTNIVEPEIITFKSGKTMSKLHNDTGKLPKEQRTKARSRTFQGFANGMADQWGKYLLNSIE